jgi:hypothetical protein
MIDSTNCHEEFISTVSFEPNTIVVIEYGAESCAFLQLVWSGVMHRFQNCNNQ